MDISESMLENCANLLQSIDPSKYTLKIGNIFNPDEVKLFCSEIKFDNIVSMWVLCYAETYEILASFFATCKELLKPNGKLFLVFSNESIIDFNKESHEKQKIKCVTHRIIRKEDDHAISSVNFTNLQTGEEFEAVDRIWKKNTIRRALEETGFEILKLSPLEIDPKVLENQYTPDYFAEATDEIGLYYCALAISR